MESKYKRKEGTRADKQAKTDNRTDTHNVATSVYKLERANKRTNEPKNE